MSNAGKSLFPCGSKRACEPLKVAVEKYRFPGEPNHVVPVPALARQAAGDPSAALPDVAVLESHRGDSEWISMSRRNFLVWAGSAFALVALCGGPIASADSPRSALASVVSQPHSAAGPGRLFFTSQGKTALINADGTGLHYFDFKIPGQATWQPGPSFADGRRVVFLSMEPRRDGPGKPFGKYYSQTPTHLWMHDLGSGSLRELAVKNRLAPFETPALLVVMTASSCKLFATWLARCTTCV